MARPKITIWLSRDGAAGQSPDDVYAWKECPELQSDPTCMCRTTFDLEDDGGPDTGWCYEALEDLGLTINHGEILKLTVIVEDTW